MQMETNTLVNLRMLKDTDKELLLMQMAANTSVNIRMVKDTDKDLFLMQRQER